MHLSLFLNQIVKIQPARSNRVKLGENLNPLEDAAGVDAIDFSIDIDNLLTKLD